MKDQLAEIERKITLISAELSEKKNQYDKEFLKTKRPNNNLAMMINNLKITLTIHQSEKEYFLLGTISQLKDEMKFLNNRFNVNDFCFDEDFENIKERLNKLTADLKFYKDKLSKLNGGKK